MLSERARESVKSSHLRVFLFLFFFYAKKRKKYARTTRVLMFARATRAGCDEYSCDDDDDEEEDESSFSAAVAAGFFVVGAFFFPIFKCFCEGNPFEKVKKYLFSLHTITHTCRTCVLRVKSKEHIYIYIHIYRI